MTLPGPSRTIIVEPVEQPAPPEPLPETEPRREPAPPEREPAPPERERDPEREPVKVP